jgi:hypothetical protein
MVDLVTCPADGCDEEGPKPSIAGHYSGSQDDRHSGGYERALFLIENADSDSPASTESPNADPDVEGTSDPTADTDRSSAGETGGLGIPSSSSTDGDSDDSRTTQDAPESCPDCGGDLRVLPTGTAFTLEDGRQGVTESDDAACVDCEALVTADGEVHH